MLNSFRHRIFLYLNNALTFPNPNPNPNFQHYLLPFSKHFSTKNSDSNSFAVSYLINNFGFTPQFASKLCSTYRVNFTTAQKPDLVLNFLRNQGLSDSQVRGMIEKAPWLLSCDPFKRVLPKFEFFRSKGASTPNIIKLVTKNPMILSPSLKNHIVPTYDLLYRFYQTDKDTIACVIGYPTLLCNHHVPRNIKMLIENGVVDLNITRMIQMQYNVFCTARILKAMEEVKDLGFNPSQSFFAIALIAKTMVNKTKWQEKIDIYKKWGWSDEDILQAFKKQPHCMMVSNDKINLVMGFWVNQLGWDALAIAKLPRVFGSSLERRMIPRAAVIKYLLKKGLLKKNASLATPFVVTDKRFLERYVKLYKEESSNLLKIYEEKLDLAHATDKTDMS